MIRSGDNRKTQLLSQLDQKIFFSDENNVAAIYLSRAGDQKELRCQR